MTRRKQEDAGDKAKLELPAAGLAAEILRELAGRRNPGQDGATPENSGADRRRERLFAFADRTAQRHPAAMPEAREESGQWVAFRLSGEIYALPVTHVEEIQRVAEITRVHGAPHPVRGIMNLRGGVLVVVDLRQRLGLQRADVQPESRVLVAAVRGRRLGLLVDEVLQVVHLLPSRIQEPPAEVRTERSGLVAGVYHLGEQLLVVLHPEQLLLLDSGPDPRAPREPSSPNDPEGKKR
jgi:purine-binding chemotaxis protein CheW